MWGVNGEVLEGKGADFTEHGPDHDGAHDILA